MGEPLKAAAAVGLSESAYYPYLMASAGAGYERAFIPFQTLAVDQRQIAQQIEQAVSQGSLRKSQTQSPELPNVSVVGGGTLATDAVASQAALGVKWLLLDFGERRAGVDAARERLMMANVGFNGTHQKIVFEVTQKFYALGNARQKVIVGKSALHAAQTVEQAVKARLDHGLAIKPELLQAQQQTAQFAFDLEAAMGEESDAQVALVESLGILPTTRLQVADLAGKPLPAEPERSVDALIDQALSYSDLSRHADNEPTPGMLPFRVESGIVYFNAEHVFDTVIARIDALREPIRLAICDLSTSANIDMAGARVLLNLHAELARRGIAFRLVEARSSVRDMLRVEGVEEKVGRIDRFTSLAEAIEDFQEQPQNL